MLGLEKLLPSPCLANGNLRFDYNGNMPYKGDARRLKCRGGLAILKSSRGEHSVGRTVGVFTDGLAAIELALAGNALGNGRVAAWIRSGVVRAHLATR